MDVNKNKRLIRFAQAAGVDESLVNDCRDVQSRGESMAMYLRELMSCKSLSPAQTRILLVAAFDFSIGRVQIVHLWCDGFVTDKEFEEHLFSDCDNAD